MRMFECYRCRKDKPESEFVWFYPILLEGLCFECSYSMDDIEHEADIEYCKMLQKEAFYTAYDMEVKE